MLLPANCIDIGAVCTFQLSTLHHHKPSLRGGRASTKRSQKGGIHLIRSMWPEGLIGQDTVKAIQYIDVYIRMVLLPVSHWITISKKSDEPRLCSSMVGLDIVRVGPVSKQLLYLMHL